MNAWQTQDWVALGGCAAGALIIGAGVGSVVTEWRRLWRLRQRAHERDEARDLLHSHGTGKGRAFCEKLAQQAGSAAQEAMSAVSDKPAPSIASAVIRGKTLIAADPEEHMDELMDSAPQVMESLRNGR